MNSFDSSIITFLNSFARHSWSFDSFVYMISGNDLLKGGVIVALVWWAWFRPNSAKDDTRQHLIMRNFRVPAGGGYRPRFGDYASFSGPPHDRRGSPFSTPLWGPTMAA